MRGLTRKITSRWCSTKADQTINNKVDPPDAKATGDSEAGDKKLPESLFKHRARSKISNPGLDAKEGGSNSEENGKGISNPEEPQPRKKLTAIFGAEGYEEDSVKKMQQRADSLRGKIVADGDGPGPGQGPKPVWTFVDAGPHHWWPAGEWSIGAPPDVYGNIPSPKQLKSSPSVVSKRSLSSTERTRETHDVWLTKMGRVNRFIVAFANRLSPQEQESFKTATNIVQFVWAFLLLGLMYMLYYHYDRWKSFGEYKVGNDSKLAKICIDLEECQSVRGAEYNAWLRGFWNSVPMPADFPSELEFIWRELIKKGWIKLDKSEEYLIAEPFRMSYLPARSSSSVVVDVKSGGISR